jgi:hypothetical protein
MAMYTVRYVCDSIYICFADTKIALWLQKIALLFGINCTEINQPQSSNMFMYIIIVRNK